jgi:thymidylate kinase
MKHDPSFFILEGPDAAGKTTLAAELAIRLPAGSTCEYMHMSYNPDNKAMFFEHHDAFVRAANFLAQGKSVVLDRSWISENIYAHVFRGKSDLGFEMRGLHRAALKLNAIYIHCIPDPASAVRRHKQSAEQREEMYTVDQADQLYRVAALFKEVALGPKVSVGIVGEEDFSNYALNIRRLIPMTQWPHSMVYDIDKDGNNLEHIVKQAYGMATMQKARQFKWDSIMHPSIPKSVWHYEYAGNVSLTADYIAVTTAMRSIDSPVWPLIGYNDECRKAASMVRDYGVPEEKIMWLRASNRSFLGHALKYLLQKKPEFKIVATDVLAEEFLLNLKLKYSRSF